MTYYRYPNYMDSWKYMEHTPYMQLSRNGPGSDFLDIKLREIKGYEKFIPKYPNTKCEPLEFLYQTHRSICAMDKLLFEDLRYHCWRSISWAAWISLVTPYPKTYMRYLLENIEDSNVNSQWVVKAAIARLNKDNFGCEVLSKAKVFQEYLTGLPFQKIPLRKFASKKQNKRYEFLKRELELIYKHQGTEAAIKFLKEQKKLEFEYTYEVWLQLKLQEKSNKPLYLWPTNWPGLAKRCFTRR